MTRRTRYPLRWNVALVVLAVLVPAAVAANSLVVTKVHRADVLEFANGWTTRLTGLRAPGPADSIGRLALEFTRREAEGRRVAVATFTTDNTTAGIVRDAEGYPFARVFLGSGGGKKAGAASRDSSHGCTFPEPELGLELLRRGYARVDSQFVFDALGEYRRVEERAREEGLGLWARP